VVEAILPEPDVVMSVRRLTKHFPVTADRTSPTAGPVRAVDEVSFDLRRGTTLGLVGETGSGKTTLARLIAGMETPTGGEIVFPGKSTGERTGGFHRLLNRRAGPDRPTIQIVFQNSYSSLNRGHQVFDILARPLKNHRHVPRIDMEEAAADLLDEVGLDRGYLHRLPGDLTDGQCQRVAIAQALAVEPVILILDEPTSSMDVPIQARILNLLLNLQDRRGLSYLFITHDLAVAQHMADEVLVMQNGRVVESGSTEEVLSRPRHPFTQALVRAQPGFDDQPRPGQGQPESRPANRVGRPGDRSAGGQSADPADLEVHPGVTDQVEDRTPGLGLLDDLP
jgi:ABC-type oligopeptide transport system ATPase subunit